MKRGERYEAKLNGLARYFTGKPCKHGHVCERFTACGKCIDCAKLNKSEADRRHYEKNADAIKSRTRNYRQLNILAVTERERSYRERNAALVSARKKDWYGRNAESVKARVAKNQKVNSEKLRAYGASYRAKNSKDLRSMHRRWVNENRERYRALQRSRVSRIRRATPKWADHSGLRRIYSDCPPGYHVDHFVPLKGVTPDGLRVSGLHLPWNLRYLPIRDNLARGNRLSAEDMAKLEILL
jgi:hypothetical protein